ncbi:fimbrial protein [Comamonas testosteroni]|uniref:fimbrial protein n=1 Tax=Comamonas testosteroni TaxID=285 RepID=UPI002DB7D949|nr:fimbrial protein [Comamonas testosteroni]MEB5964139.1 type 1 fimbrial protein [Comamonas testosteroni]
MKTFFHSSSATSRWAWLARAGAACAVIAGILQVPDAAAAGGQQCSNPSMTPDTGWNIRSGNVGVVTNGYVIADLNVSHIVTAFGVAKNYTFSVGVTGPLISSTYQTAPLNTLPGLGVRWKWMGYEDVQDALLVYNEGTVKPPGTAITGGNVDFVMAKFAKDGTTKKIKLKWKVELVVTDARRYRGGRVDFAQETVPGSMKIMPSVTDNFHPVVKQACDPVFSSFDKALAGHFDLPDPTKPSCYFPVGSLHQTVPLGTVPAGSVPADGSSRASTSRETKFQIQASNCVAGTAYSIYFTDANAVGESKNYLSSQGALANKVNLRLFSAGNNTPVSFGPAPSGSSLPHNPPGVMNAGTTAGSSHVHDFYVQYVRAPGVDASALSPGDLTAKAIITVVYP